LTVVDLAHRFGFQSNPSGLVAVHCTHGFNRTGFLISSYLVEVMGYILPAALDAFSTARPLGTYKQHYVDELVQRYRWMGVRLYVLAEKPAWMKALADEAEYYFGFRDGYQPLQTAALGANGTGTGRKKEKKKKKGERSGTPTATKTPSLGVDVTNNGHGEDTKEANTPLANVAK